MTTFPSGTIRPELPLYNAQVNMIETPTMTTVEPGTQTGTIHPETSDFTGLEIAKLCGYISDRWTRNERAELEEILAECRDGKKLIEKLKALDGKRYSGFALDLIQEKQRLTSSAIPLLKDGKPVFTKGVAKLQRVDRRLSKTEYKTLLLERYGKALSDEDFDPERSTENTRNDPDAVDGVFVEEDPELISTKLVFQEDDRTAEIAQIQDDSAAIIDDAYSGLNSMELALVKQFKDRGASLGAKAMQAYGGGFQEALNQGTTDLNKGGTEEQASKVSRKATKKKSG